ncbi:unnamed protein product [Diatraea saccharalis]|uniref:Uncharacterized protein n=1 Tax=Diatraea saccharalis TaxID=40085 RepID=A0A9N9QZV1_9NEOP|nr:unnamed protein product [Diatraea saccharalis]
MLLASAGKVNFFLLEESHPRDLERNLMPMVLDPPSIYCKNKDIVQKVTETNKSNIKERKRKNYSDELIESKEKKKRESAKAEKYRLLKESYEKTPKEIEYEEKSKILHNTPDKIVTTNVPNLVNRISVNEDTYNEPFDDLTYLESNIKDFDTESVENKKIDSILNEIENEMKFINQGALRGVKKGTSSRNNKQTTMNPYKNKQGHNFIDLLEKNIEFSEDDEMQEKENGFSEAIKKQVDKYLQSRYDPVVSDPLLADIVNEHDFETSQSPESKLKSHDKSTERGNVENIIDTINPVTENQTVTNISAAVNKNNVEELVCNKAVTEKTAEKVLDEIHTEQLTNEKFLNRQEEQYSRVELNNNQQGKFVSHNKKIQLTQNNNSNYLALLEGKNYSTSYNIDDNYNETEEYKRANVTDDTIKSKNNKNDHEANNHHNILLKAAITNDVDEIKYDKANSLQSSPLSKISKYEHNAHFSSSSHNQPRKKQENKYKFSTEKIDIRSKFSNENEIHIIRKLRIDIGITETILENKVPSDCSAPLNQENVYEKNKVKNKSLIPIEYNANREQLNDFEQDKNNDVQERNIINENVENIQYYKHDTITDNIKTNKKETAMDGKTTVDYNKLNNCMNTNTNIERVINKYSKAHLNQENAYENNKPLIPIDYNASVYDINNGTHGRNITNENNFKNTENNIHDNITDNSKTIKEERVMDGITTNNNNNEPNNSMNTKTNIESVLKKYSKVFSNRYKNVRTPSVQNLNYKQSKPMKPNKPFKITDIQNLNIQLDNLCDSPKSTNTIAKSEIDKLTITNKNTLEVKKEKPNQLFTMTEIENRNVPKNNFYESLKSTSYTTIGEIEKEEIQDRIAAKPFEEDEFEEDTINDNILSLQCTTLNEVDDLKEEFDVDHAMLNPKTLLKCYDRNDYYNTDIIPPPPEFSDNTYSPKLDDYLANNCFQENLLHIKSDCIGPQHDFSKNELNEHKTDSMYKETETWTLDNDDDVTEDDYFSWNHIHDYNNGNNIERYVYPNTVSLKQRHGKLHQFKFHRKNKYNPKL